MMILHELYGVAYFVRIFTPVTRLNATLCKIKSTIKKRFNRNIELLQHPPPYRLEHSSEYPPLIPKSNSSGTSISSQCEAIIIVSLSKDKNIPVIQNDSTVLYKCAFAPYMHICIVVGNIILCIHIA